MSKAEIRETYRNVKGKDIQVVVCINEGAGRKGELGIFFDNTTYVLRNKADASEKTIREIGPDHEKWKDRSWQVVTGGLWNTTVMLQMLLNILPFR